jgi:hypothetical protein
MVEVPKITKADIPKKARRIAIYADCSGSMAGESFYNLVTALNALWPIEGAELYGYSDGFFTTHRANTPDDLRQATKWTYFASMLRKAARINADMTLIFSDGMPQDEHQMWAIWNATSFPISTHLCLSEEHLQDNKDAVWLMQTLCRGGGQFTYGSSIPLIQSGVSQAMANEYNPRALPDYTDQIETGARRARGKMGVNKRVIELGNELADVRHDVGELQGRQTISGSMEKVFANIDEMAIEAFDEQRCRKAANDAAVAEQHESLGEGLMKLGARILGRVKCEFNQALDTQRKGPVERAAAVQIGRVSLNRDVLHRSAAISTARTPRAAALPTPSERPLMIEAPRVNETSVRSRVTVERPVVVVRRRKS